jgi:hypothetical protein
MQQQAKQIVSPVVRSWLPENLSCMTRNDDGARQGTKPHGTP